MLGLLTGVKLLKPRYGDFSPICLLDTDLYLFATITHRSNLFTAKQLTYQTDYSAHSILLK
jgi:hypothetical protein